MGIKPYHNNKEIAMRLGNCYESAVNHMVDSKQEFGIKTMTLVHGIVTGQHDLEGAKFLHAWCELDGLVFDLSNNQNISMDKDLYYSIGKIVDTVRYSFDDMCVLCIESNHYGHWDEDLASKETITWKKD